MSPDALGVVMALRGEPGKDIAVFGGGVPFLPSPAIRAALKLTKHRLYEKRGIVGLWHDIERP